MSSLLNLSLCDLASRIASGVVTSREAVEASLEAIELRNPELNAFLTVIADVARDTARRRDRERAAGRLRGPLHGVPIAYKDLLWTRTVKTTAGSRILADWLPPEDAEVVRRLETAGAVSLGKLHMHEFAFGATGENLHLGPARNPHDPTRLCGGSSSGSGAAVAAGLCYGAVGSDTGGSIRCPAALCGIVGLKPTRGRVPLHGAVPLAWSLDHLGPMTRTVHDAAQMLAVMAADDNPDLLPSHRRRDGRLNGLRVGVLDDPYWHEADERVLTATSAGIGALQDAGASVAMVEVGEMDRAAAAQFVILSSEAAAFHTPWLATRSADYDPAVRERLVRGLLLDAVDLVHAQQVRERFRARVDELFREVDLLASPAVPVTAPAVGQSVVRAGSLVGPPHSFMVRNTFLFNMTGHPAVSVPCGPPDGLPVGLQLAARAGEEALLLGAAAEVERRLPAPVAI